MNHVVVELLSPNEELLVVLGEKHIKSPEVKEICDIVVNRHNHILHENSRVVGFFESSFGSFYINLINTIDRILSRKDTCPSSVLSKEFLISVLTEKDSEILDEIRKTGKAHNIYSDGKYYGTITIEDINNVKIIKKSDLEVGYKQKMFDGLLDDGLALIISSVISGVFGFYKLSNPTLGLWKLMLYKSFCIGSVFTLGCVYSFIISDITMRLCIKYFGHNSYWVLKRTLGHVPGMGIIFNRDEYMAGSINEIMKTYGNDSKIAIVGKAHIPGITAHLTKSYGFTKKCEKSLEDYIKDI